MSFLDCPGADILLATMLNGLVAMDAAILLIGMFLLVIYGHLVLNFRITYTFTIT